MMKFCASVFAILAVVIGIPLMFYINDYLQKSDVTEEREELSEVELPEIVENIISIVYSSIEDRFP